MVPETFLGAVVLHSVVTFTRCRSCTVKVSVASWVLITETVAVADVLLMLVNVMSSMDGPEAGLRVTSADVTEPKLVVTVTRTVYSVSLVRFSIV